MSEKEWNNLFNRLLATMQTTGNAMPAVSELALVMGNDPFIVLISTLLSLRTKDAVTKEASLKLFALAKTPYEMINLTTAEIEKAIYPCGFYHRKAENIIKISHILIDSYDGKVPSDKDALIALPGVGIKTANLTLNLGFQIEAICVDCHVHQIANRMGWITTNTPEQSEVVLQTIMPKKFWIPLNELLVSYGQTICTSVSPKCSLCSENATCPKIGVTHSR